MREVYIVEAVRSPIGRRKGAFAGMYPADLLGTVQKAAVERAGIDPAAVGQVVGGCVSQVGEQSFNIARVAWLAAGLPMEVASTTVDSQCGSSQQATSIAAGLIGAGIEDLVLACGVEMMTRVPLGSNMKGGFPMSPAYLEHYAPTSQFQGAEMIAKEYGISREDTDRFGLASQYTRAARGTRAGSIVKSRRSPRPCWMRRASPPERSAWSRATKVFARRRSRSWRPSSPWRRAEFTRRALPRRYRMAQPRSSWLHPSAPGI
jgi:acetyl-CoA C-acetyltransferase